VGWGNRVKAGKENEQGGEASSSGWMDGCMP